MGRVFVSHASEDRECAGQLHQWLVGEGHEVFLDRDLHDGIPVGDEWEQRLHERLRWADAVVCVVTSAYLASLWCTAEVGTQGRAHPLSASGVIMTYGPGHVHEQHANTCENTHSRV